MGEIAHELAVLVRSDLELTAAQRAPELRQLTVDVAAACVAGAAGFLALAAATAAAILGLAQAMSAWGAALVVAGTWVVVTVVMLRLGHVDRLRARFAEGSEEPAIAAARAEHSDAEQAIKAASSRLARAIVRETAEREVKSVVAAEQRIAETVERDVESILRELVSALSVPEKAGGFLGRITRRGP
jgi:predicted RND superfamily exporter protein